MKLSKITFILLIIFLFYLGILSVIAYTQTISLEFDRVVLPPNSFVSHKQIKRPRIGLCLSGGGARGFAQIGVLQVLEDHKIPIDIIVGSSIGSIVGGLFAAGYSAYQIEEITRNIDWDKIMVDSPPRTSLFVSQKQERSKAIIQIRFDGFKIAIPQALTPGQRLTSILTTLSLRADYLTNQNFDRLEIPFRALACDLVSGRKVILKNGNLAEAMRASSAVPLLFEPVERDNMLLVDGGLINNIPVEEVKEFDVDLIIAIDTSSELNDKSSLYVPWKLADQVTSIMQKEKNEQQRKLADVLIRPDLGDFKSDDFPKIDQIIDLGKEKANDIINQIENIFHQKKEEENLSKQGFFVSSIELMNGNDSLINEQILFTIKKTIQTPTKLQHVKKSLEEIYQLGYFSDVHVEYTIEDSLLSLKYYPVPNPSFKEIVVHGNHVFSDSLIKAQVKSKPGAPINFYDSKKDIERITNLYQANGYGFINIMDVKIDHETLHIYLNEGIISSINVTGNIKTRDFAILREFPLIEGDIFNLDKVDQGLKNIYSTNLFKTVSLKVQNSDRKPRLTIKVEEKQFNLLRLGYRYDLIRKNKTLLEIVDENFLGLANPITFHAQYGIKDKIFKFKYRADRIINTFLTGNFELYHQQLKRYVYDDGKNIGEYLTRENGFSLSIGSQIKRLGILSFIASIKNIEMESVSGYGYPTSQYDLKTFAIQSIVDTQDKYPFPNFGKYYTFLYKMSSASFLNSQISYFQFYSSLETYYTFFKRNTVHYKFMWGTSDLTTPFIEQFRLGGIQSFYGLKQDEKIGKHLFAGSFEYRYRFPFGFPIDFYLSFRYDIGATWKNTLEIKPKDFDHGFGTCFSVNTLAGPISLSMGKRSEGNRVVYFSVGFDF